MTESVKTKNEADSKATTNTKESLRESSWPSVLFYIHLNILGLYGLVILFTHTSFTTIIFSKLPPKYL